MITQPDMFAREPRAVARRGDLDTSHLAAEDITPRIRILQAAVLSFAASCRPLGFTDPAMNEHFDTHSSTYRTRRAELVAMDMIEDSGERVGIGASCGSACKKEPVGGVIGFQKGPLISMV